MINRSECTCACHTNPGVIHVAACCRPDPTPKHKTRIRNATPPEFRDLLLSIAGTVEKKELAA